MAVKEKKSVKAVPEAPKRRGRPPKSTVAAEKTSPARSPKLAKVSSSVKKAAVKAKPGRKPGVKTVPAVGAEVRRGPGRPPLNRPVPPKVLDRFSVPKLVSLGKQDAAKIKLLYTPAVFAKIEKWCGLSADASRIALGVKDGARATMTAEQTKRLGMLVASIEQLRKKFGVYGAKLWLNEKADEFSGKTPTQIIKSTNGISQFGEVVAKLKSRPPVPGPRRGRKPGTKVAVSPKAKRAISSVSAKAKKNTVSAKAKPAAKVAKASSAKSAAKPATAKRGKTVKAVVKTAEVKRRGRPPKASQAKAVVAKAKPVAKKPSKTVQTAVSKTAPKKPGRKPKLDA